MLTSFDQVRDWILDNGFKRWVLYRDRSKTEKIIDSAAFAVSDTEDKIAMTEKYLRMAGGYAYAAGAGSNATSDLSTVCEIRLSDVQTQQLTQGVGNMQPQFNVGELRNSIKKELEAEWEKKEYARLRADLDKERKQFEAEKNSALGAITHYFYPIGQAMLQKHLMPKVAGVDAEQDVRAARIVAERTPEQQHQAEQEQELIDTANNFTDEEADKLYSLMARFKAVEPQYMELIEAVVTMAESGDSMYTMAKGILIK